MSATVPTSIQLWAASKIIGRECATENRKFFMCKKDKGQNPLDCESEGTGVTNCVTQVVTDLNARFPTEYTAFQKCLDYNDYRFGDCRKTERDLLDCWNKVMES
mmetsp:Transcript_5233/g.5363  ORF Transcript_5233/g.5363 Transcript_5233/m.5363 type:complete len:104 (-) Transcript_5233:180-491(-)